MTRLLSAINKNSFYGKKEISSNPINIIPFGENLFSKDFDDEIAEEIKEEVFYKSKAKTQENNCVCNRSLKKLIS